MKSLSFTHCLFSWNILFSVLTATMPIADKKLVKSTFKPVTHVIFTVEDVLLKTQNIYNAAYALVTKKFNKDLRSDIPRLLLGYSPQDAAKIIVKEMKLPVSAEQFKKMAEDIYLNLLPDASLMPGAEKLCKHLYKNNVTMAMVTGGSSKALTALFRNHEEFFKMFAQVIIAEEDLNMCEYKPAPDVFISCVGKLTKSLLGRKVLVFENTPIGVQAVKKAKMHMQVVLVSNAILSPQLREEADLCIDSLSDFKPKLFELPAY